MSYKNIHAQVCNDLGYPETEKTVEEIFKGLSQKTQKLLAENAIALSKTEAIIKDCEAEGVPVFK